MHKDNPWHTFCAVRTCVGPRALLWQSQIKNKTRIPHVPHEDDCHWFRSIGIRQHPVYVQIRVAAGWPFGDRIIQNHHAVHLSPDHTAFCKNIGEAHKFFFSKHKDGKHSCRAIQLGCPSDTNVDKQPANVKAQPAKVTGQQKRLDFFNSSDDDDVPKEKPET